MGTGSAKRSLYDKSACVQSEAQTRLISFTSRREQLLIRPRKAAADPVPQCRPTVGLEASTTRSVETFSQGASEKKHLKIGRSGKPDVH
jgi:hypothetical protein